MNDLITTLNLSKSCKVTLAIDTRLFVMMSEDKIIKSIRILFKAYVGFENIKILSCLFGKTFMFHCAYIY